MKRTTTTIIVLFLILLAASPSASARKGKGEIKSLEHVSKKMKKTACKNNFFYMRSAVKDDMKHRNYIFHHIEPDFTVSDTLIYIAFKGYHLLANMYNIYWIYASSPNRIMEFYQKSGPDVILERAGSYAGEKDRNVRFIIDMAIDKKFDTISESAISTFTDNPGEYYYAVIIRENDGFRLMNYERLGQTFRQLREREAIIIVPDLIPNESQ